MKKCVFILCLILLTACNSFTARQTEIPIEEKASIEEPFQLAEMKLKELADKNIEWLNENEGWLSYKVNPMDGGLSEFGFTSQECWYLLKNGTVKQGLQIVSSEAMGGEVQRYVINLEGYRAELIELRQNGLNAQGHAIPYLANWKSEDLSWSYMDIAILNGMKDFIVEIDTKEVDFEGLPALNIQITFGGDTQLRGLGLPPGKDKIGKIENFYYDLETGRRLAYTRAFINADESIDPASGFTESWDLKLEPSQAFLEEIEQANNEVDFYLKLFDLD